MGEITEKKTTKKKKNSISTSPCAQLRSAYHQCFNRWYSEKFVKGQWSKEECVSEWEKYRACLSQHLDDKHLSRFLEAESMYSTAPDDDPARFFASGGGGGGRSH